MDADELIDQMDDDQQQRKLSPERTIKQYIKLRDKKKALEEELKQRIKPIQARMDELAEDLGNTMDDQDINNMSTDAGGAHFTKRKRYKIVDRAAVEDWVRETGNFSVFQARINKAAVEELELPGDGVPPGVQMDAFKQVVVRTPRN